MFVIMMAFHFMIAPKVPKVKNSRRAVKHKTHFVCVPCVVMGERDGGENRQVLMSTACGQQNRQKHTRTTQNLQNI
jgi:hypothetical protein